MTARIPPGASSSSAAGRASETEAAAEFTETVRAAESFGAGSTVVGTSCPHPVVRAWAEDDKIAEDDVGEGAGAEAFGPVATGPSPPRANWPGCTGKLLPASARVKTGADADFPVGI